MCWLFGGSRGKGLGGDGLVDGGTGRRETRHEEGTGWLMMEMGARGSSGRHEMEMSWLMATGAKGQNLV